MFVKLSVTIRQVVVLETLLFLGREQIKMNLVDGPVVQARDRAAV